MCYSSAWGPAAIDWNDLVTAMQNEQADETEGSRRGLASPGLSRKLESEEELGEGNTGGVAPNENHHL